MKTVMMKSRTWFNKQGKQTRRKQFIPESKWDKNWLFFSHWIMFAWLLPHFLPWRWFSRGGIEVRSGVSRDWPLPEGKAPLADRKHSRGSRYHTQGAPTESQARARKSRAGQVCLWHSQFLPPFLSFFNPAPSLTLSTRSHAQVRDLAEESVYYNVNLLSLGENEYLREETLNYVRFHKNDSGIREYFDLCVPRRSDLQTFMRTHPLKNVQSMWLFKLRVKRLLKSKYLQRI